MPETGFHFAQPGWLWALLALVPVALWLIFTSVRAQRGPVDRYADQHLLPHAGQKRAAEAAAGPVAGDPHPAGAVPAGTLPTCACSAPAAIW